MGCGFFLHSVDGSVSAHHYCCVFTGQRKEGEVFLADDGRDNPYLYRNGDWISLLCVAAAGYNSLHGK